MKAAQKNRINKAELKLIADSLIACSEAFADFSDDELNRFIQLGGQQKKQTLMSDEALELARLEAKIKPVNFNFSEVMHLIADPDEALDRLEKANLFH